MLSAQEKENIIDYIQSYAGCDGGGCNVVTDIDYLLRYWNESKSYFLFSLFSVCHFRSLYPNLPQSALCFGRVGRNFNCQFLHDTFVLFPRFEDQKHPFLGMECTKTEKITKKNVFFQKIFGQFKKKQYLCTRFREESKSSVK